MQTILLTILGVICTMFYFYKIAKLQIEKYFAGKLNRNPREYEVKVISVENCEPYKKIHVAFECEKLPVKGYFMQTKPQEFRTGEVHKLFLQFFFPESGLLVGDF